MLTRKAATQRRMRELFQREVETVGTQPVQPKDPDADLPILDASEAEEPLLDVGDVVAALDAKLREAPVPPPLPPARPKVPPVPEGGYRTDRFFRKGGR
jgi:hypothetical protein